MLAETRLGLSAAHTLELLQSPFVLFEFLPGFGKLALRCQSLIFLKLLNSPIHQLLDRLRRNGRGSW